MRPARTLAAFVLSAGLWAPLGAGRADCSERDVLDARFSGDEMGNLGGFLRGATGAWPQ